MRDGFKLRVVCQCHGLVSFTARRHAGEQRLSLSLKIHWRPCSRLWTVSFFLSASETTRKCGDLTRTPTWHRFGGYAVPCFLKDKTTKFTGTSRCKHTTNFLVLNFQVHFVSKPSQTCHYSEISRGLHNRDWKESPGGQLVLVFN